MAAITITDGVLGAGVEVPFVAASVSDTYDNSTQMVSYRLRNENGSGSVTVTIPKVKTTRDGDADWPTHTISDITFSLPFGKEYEIANVPRSHIAVDGKVTVNLSSATNIKCAAVKRPL